MRVPPTSAPSEAAVPRTSRRRFLGGAIAATALAGAVVRPSAMARQPDSAVHVQAVASSDVAATDAGLAVLARGGTAADAAIAVAAVLSVVEPWFSSALGGDTWALYYDAAEDAVTSLDGVGPVSANATLAGYRERAGEPGIHQAIVPAAWDAWMLWLDRYGRLDLGTIMAPAIRIAREGSTVSPEMAEWLARQETEIRSFPDTARVYAPQGTLAVEGDVVRQTGMADTFDALVRAYNDALGESRSAAVQAARDYFYRGPLAEAIVDFSNRNGGYFSLEDFSAFEAEIVDPISIAYDDAITVFENPPNSQGITMLLALNILKGLELSALEPASADAVHLQAEAIKLAFADRYRYIGDPDRIEIPVEALLSEDFAAGQRARIELDSTLDWPIVAGRAAARPSHTTTFHIVDQYGNGAAVTTSLGGQFLVVGDTGIHINERMQFLSLEEGNVNQLTPGSKVRHTSCPYLVMRDNRLYILGGNTGVDTQPQGQTQQFLSIVEFGLGAQDAVDLPRFVSTAFPATTYPYAVGNTLQLQEGFGDDVISDLESRGHQVVVGEGIFGSANLIVIDEGGANAQVGVESATSRAHGEVIPAGS